MSKVGENSQNMSFVQTLQILAEHRTTKYIKRGLFIVVPLFTFVVGASVDVYNYVIDIPVVIEAHDQRIGVIEKGFQEIKDLLCWIIPENTEPTDRIIEICIP